MINTTGLVCIILLLILIFIMFGIMIHFYKVFWEKEEKLRNDKEDK